MAENLPTLTVPPTRKPSFVNMRAAIGFAIGWLVPVVPFAPAIGLGVGAWLGKRKMEHEQVNGKQVSPPSSWNIGTFFGGMGGLSIGSAAATIGLAALAVSTGGVGLLGWLGAGFVTAASTAIGGWVGGKIGKQFQKREYASAEQYVQQHGEFTGPQQELARQQSQAMGQAMGLQQSPMQQPAHRQGQEQNTALAQARQRMDPQQLAQLQALAAQGARMAPPQPESMADKVGHSRQTGPQER